MPSGTDRMTSGATSNASITSNPSAASVPGGAGDTSFVANYLRIDGFHWYRGCLLFSVSAFTLLAAYYAILISKLGWDALVLSRYIGSEPHTKSSWGSSLWPAMKRGLEAIEQDRYYCLLLVYSIPMLLLFVYVNWVGLKLFQHNTGR